MQWHDGYHSGFAVEDQGSNNNSRRDFQLSPSRRRRSPDHGFGYGNDGRRNGNAYPLVMEGTGFGSSSARFAGGNNGDGSGRVLAGEGNPAGAAGGGGGEDDAAAVLHLLEKHSAKHSRRPSTAHVDLLERGAVLKTRMFGPQSSAARKALRDTIVACNSLAMSALGRGNTDRCKDLLDRAFEIASDTKLGGRPLEYDLSCDGGDPTIGRGGGGGGDPALQILTLNNSACLHRRLGEPKRALRCLRRAAELGRQSKGSEHLEVTHLNACAVLSELGRHEEALEHARSAVYYGQELEEARAGKGGENPAVCGEGRLSSSGCVGGSTRAHLATLAISYYNLAVELEYTHRYEACLRWYNEAVKLARHPNVHNEELVRTFQRSFAGARKKHGTHQLRRSSGIEKGLTPRKANPSRAHGEKVPNRSSPSSFSLLRPLQNDASAGSPDSFEPGQEVSSRHRRRMDPEAGGNGDPNPQQLYRQVEWPVFGRVERQRVKDERRSQIRHNSCRNRNHLHANINSDGGIEPQDFVPRSTEPIARVVHRRDPLSQLQQKSRHSQGETFQNTARNNQERAMGKMARVRPVSGSAAGKDGGCGLTCDSTLPLKLPRKRPASADEVRERNRRVPVQNRLDLSKSPYAEHPPMVEPVWKRQQQQQQHHHHQTQRERGVIEARVPKGKPSGAREHGVAAAEPALDGRNQQRCCPFGSSQRPKSAYPRLEEGGSRPGESSSIGISNESNGRNHGKKSSRVFLMRSLSAQALRGSTSSSSATVNSRERERGVRIVYTPREEGGGGDLALTREEDEEEEEEEGTRNEMSRELKKRSDIQRVEFTGSNLPSREGRGGARTAMTTPMKTTNPGRYNLDTAQTEDNADTGGDVEQSDGQHSSLAFPSALVSGKDSSITRKSIIQARAGAPPERKVDETTSPPGQTTAGGRTRKVTKARRNSPRASPSRRRRRGQATDHRQEKTPYATAESPCCDNGRDGKLYRVEVESKGEQSGNPVRLDSARYDNSNDQSPDNGRDGKLYVELDNGRDGKLYLETEDSDIGDLGGKSRAPAPLEVIKCHDESVSTIGGMSASRPQDDAVDNCARHKSLELATVGKSSTLERLEATRIIHNAVTDAFLRRQMACDGGQAEGECHEIPRKQFLDEAKGVCRVLTERDGDGAQRTPERVSIPDAAALNLEAKRSEMIIQERRRLAREAVNRRILAASTIRGWVARASLLRRLKRKRRTREDLKLRWEPEIHRIAATRVQALARGFIWRRDRRMMELAAIDIQRKERGRQGRSAMNELARARQEERDALCEVIQKLVRGHQGRQKALRMRKIAMEETVAHHGAACVLQYAWRHSRRRCQLLLEQQLRHSLKNAIASVVPGKGEDSATAAASAMTPMALTKQRTSDALPKLTSDEQLLQGAETLGAVYAVWGALTSLLAAKVTRHAVRRAVGDALLAPAVATLASFNRIRREVVAATPSSSSTSLSPSSPCRIRRADPPNPGSFDCAQSFDKDMVAAGRRMAGAVRALESSLSVVRAAAWRFLGGASHVCDSDDGSGSVGRSGTEEGKTQEEELTVMETAEAEVVSLVSKNAEECWTLLSSFCNSPPMRLNDADARERLTEFFSNILQSLISNLGRIRSRLQAAQDTPHGKGQNHQPSAGDTGNGFLDGERGRCHLDSSQHQPLLLPIALVRALASSATALLLSHPDLMGSTHAQEETGDLGMPVGGGWDGDEERTSNRNELSRLVAEVYCSFLVFPNSEGGGCGANGNQRIGEGDGKKPPGANSTPRKSVQSSLYTPPPSSWFVHVRTDERFRFLRFIAELIDGSAEEIVGGMGVSGVHHDDVVRRMTNGVWEVARYELVQSAVDDVEEEEEEFSGR